MQDKTNAHLKGSCLCGAVKYQVTKLEPKMAHCHCTMCRKFHGAAFSTFGEALTENFTWLQGESYLKSFTAENGTTRQFCSQCGSSLTFASSTNTGSTVEFSLATLDTPILERPDAHIHCQSKADWYEITDELTQFQRDRE